ncbi:hypothetical protein MXB_1204, partial [Myxobolus squamalis]
MNEYKSIDHSEKRIMIVFSMEPPSSIRIDFEYKRSKDYFNHWVYSYYTAGFLYGPYGDYTELNESQYSFDTMIQQFETRNSAALSIISNCQNTFSRRLDYINLLKKYFNVDLFGRCSGYFISQIDRHEKLSKYKFFIAAENSHCLDYITEKYWKALYYGAIPILIGYPQNLTALIPNTFINAFDFSNPKDLGNYLH